MVHVPKCKGRLWAQRTQIGTALRAKYILLGYMDPWGSSIGTRDTRDYELLLLLSGA